MAHEQRIVTCSGPGDPHALDGIAVLPRSGQLDAPCPHCHGRGQWNREFDLVSQRSKRSLCHACDGHGWIETGSDPVACHDTELSETGQPRWVTRLGPAGSGNDPPRS